MKSFYRWGVMTVLCCTVATTGLRSASAEIIYGLTTQNMVSIIDSDDPEVSIDGGNINNLMPNETLLAIDYRAATGRIYVLGASNNVYTVAQSGDATAFDATFVGNFSPPNLQGSSYAFDFNPAFMDGEFARIISDTDDNRVISGNTGQYLAPVEKTDVFYNTGDTNEGENPNIAGIAYTNSLFIPTGTQQYGIDASLGILATVANNAGTLDTVGPLGVAGLTNELGFDISGATGIAYAALQNSPNSQLYTIDLGTGSASLLGKFGSGDLIRSLTVLPAGGVDPNDNDVPEPTSMLLLGGGLLGLGLVRRRK
ncbi:DUF4394 domain-containing protein [Adhaeretor mobilis]|uniref:PEP-CTERM motif protein n=1 Tax=Adhaeretor mobilis TaxID=1930276 RepID=A0A517N1X2_9BACT|nr:DUF4394 domain-containing protein [Adhaeretor mobilis]QDT01115.1 PEP-CTERM motif protein [Adhaeretor mobilis]